MSKITNALLMMKLLSNGRVYSVKELSEELGVTERMVRNYKEQLEMSGYIIESFKGPGGGYFINKNLGTIAFITTVLAYYFQISVS